MLWQKQLKELEDHKKWDQAILLMEHVILEFPTLEAYLAMSYLLMNLLVEEDYDFHKRAYYEALSKKYFNKGYEEFLQNPEYLFFMGIIAGISEWYVGLKREDIHAMLAQALSLEPENDLYRWGYYGSLQIDDPSNKSDSCAERISADLNFMWMLKCKGSLGEYIVEMLAYRTR